MDGVTVVIPVYNRESYVGEAIDSVRAQTRSDWQLIVVDDASTDGTPAVLAALSPDPRITVIRRNSNGGAARALNSALAATNTPFLLQLDSDDWLSPDCLEILCAVAVLVPDDVGVVYADFTTWIESEEALAFGWTTRCPLYRNEYEVFTRWGSACPRMYRTAALRQVGGWDTQGAYEGRYVEDMTMISRVARRYGLCHVDREVYHYRWHGSNESSSLELHRHYIHWLVRSRLAQWGGHYVPIFSKRPNSETVPDVRLLGWSRSVEPERNRVVTGAVRVREGTGASCLEPVTYAYTVSWRRGDVM